LSFISLKSAVYAFLSEIFYFFLGGFLSDSRQEKSSFSGFEVLFIKDCLMKNEKK